MDRHRVLFIAILGLLCVAVLAQNALTATSAPVYDWRELKRWKISESRLPPASIVRFREPTLWEQYRWYIVGALAVITVQAVLIVGLLLQRVRRRRAEAELQESRELMELSTNAGELGLWARDLKTGDFSANSRLRSLFGFGPQDVMRFEDVVGRVHPDDRAQMVSAVDRARRADEPVNLEYRAILPDGKERWLAARGSTILDREGRALRRVGNVIDITARKQAAEIFQSVVEAAPYAMVIVNGEGRITLVNAQTEVLFGYTRLELIGQSIEMLVPERFGSQHVGDRHAYFANAKPRSMGMRSELHGRRKDGSEVPVEISLSPIRAAEGLSVLASIIDITRRKRAGEVLRQSEERYRTLAETATDVIVIMDQDSTILFVNAAVERVFGYSPAELVGQKITALMPEPQRQRHIEGLRRYLKTGEKSLSWGAVSFAALHKSGREIGLEIAFAESRINDRPVFTGILRDITERKQTEEAMAKQRLFLRQVIDVDPNFIFAKDRDGRFTLVNQAVAEAYGTTVEGLIGKTDADFNPNRDEVEHFHRMDLEVIDKLQERFIAEERLTDAQGKIRWLQTVKRPIIGKGGVADQVLGASTDITRRKQMEAELQQQREDLAHVTRVSLMGELTASLAHELNQPLTAILANAQAAQRFLTAKPVNLDEVREILKDIVDDDNRAGDVIRRIRALVKKEKLAFARMDLSAVIRDVVRLVRSDAGLRNVEVHYQGGDEVPAVHGDRVQLQQVVLNLLLNAFDAMKDSPANEREVVVRAETNGAGTVEVSVRDHGTGLTSDKLDKIFQPFYTTKRDGLGMGLSISRSIIEAHGGRLWAENNADRGATFYFTVPIFEQAHVAMEGV